jgi:tetratricopeptide (TPR) repeat protein
VNVVPRILRCLTLCSILLWFPASAAGQIAAVPQAGSPEEFDAYLRVLEFPGPREVITAAEDFLRQWPESGLRAHVYELEFEAYRQTGDTDKAISAGEKGLAAAPDNLELLASLALILPNNTRDVNRLSRAQQYAARLLSLLESFKVPKWIPPDQWDEIESGLKSRAHAALGLVANGRGDLTGAIRQFEEAVKIAPAPDATHYYRLGLLYLAAGRKPEALTMLRQAAEGKEPTIRDLARRELAALQGQ